MQLKTFLPNSLPACYKEFVISSYTRILRNSCPYFSAIQKETYYPIAKNTILDKLETSYVKMFTDDEIIIGYSIYSEVCFHVILIKRLYRGEGLVKDLLPDTDVSYYSTFLNKNNKNLLKNLGFELIFNPYSR